MFIKKRYIFIVVFLLIYFISTSFRSVINYINPLSKPIIAFIGKKYVESKYSINTDIKYVQAYFPEPACFTVCFVTKDEPYIEFSYSRYLDYSNRGDSYYLNVFDYIIDRDLSAQVKEVFGEDLIKCEYFARLKDDFNLDKNISDININDFYDSLEFITVHINMNENEICNYNFTELYELIKIYKALLSKNNRDLNSKIYFRFDDKSKSNVIINIDDVMSEQDVIDLFYS